VVGRPLRSAILELTNRCNLRCVHCGSSSGSAREGELSIGRLLGVVDELAETGCGEITLLGGELFLRRGWEKVAARVRERGCRLVVVTNGLLLTGTRARRLTTFEPYVVGVSIDGATPGSYARVRGGDGFAGSLAALHRLVEGGFPAVNAITTFHRLNLPDFDLFAALLRGTGINWQVQIAGRGGERFPADLFFTLEDYTAFTRKVFEAKEGIPDLKLSVMDDFGYFPLHGGGESLQRWPGCQAGVSILAVRSDGAILPCLALGDAFVAGSAKETPLAALWEDDARFDLFRRKLPRLRGACAACDVKERCRGGCSAIAWSATGSIFENPYCLRAIQRRELVDALCETRRD